MLILQHVDDAISQQNTFFRTGITNSERVPPIQNGCHQLLRGPHDNHRLSFQKSTVRCQHASQRHKRHKPYFVQMKVWRHFRAFTSPTAVCVTLILAWQ